MYKGIDVSSYQKNGIDYDKLKQDGVEFAILKIIRKDLEKDNGFEQHYNGFNHAQIPIIGVYNYSYASTVDKFKTDAEAVVKALNGRKKKVWLDIENEAQMGIGDTLIDGINAYFGVLRDYGLDYGIYTGLKVLLARKRLLRRSKQRLNVLHRTLNAILFLGSINIIRMGQSSNDSFL